MRRNDKEILPMVSSSLTSTTSSSDTSSFSSAWGATNSVLEARRRKFESSVPIESSNKRIRLKKSTEGGGEGTTKEEGKRLRMAVQSSAPASDSLVLATDDLEELLDLELENAMKLWSDDDSNSDNEARFKSADKTDSSSEAPKIRVVPLYKLQGLEHSEPAEKEKKRIRPVSTNSREHSIHSSRDGSRKNNRSVRGEQEQKDLSDNGELDASPEEDQKKSKMIMSATDALDDPEEFADGSKDGDLRAELSRRRAERLTMAGSVHETLPARLVQSAFKDAVGKKNFRRLDRERHGVLKRPESQKGAEAGDGRRVLVLKSSAVEQQIPSLSVTIPKEEKASRRGGSPASGGKVPVHMRLGLPGGGSGYSQERERERERGERPASTRRRGSRKVKLKRNVLLASPAGEKVCRWNSYSQPVYNYCCSPN